MVCLCVVFGNVTKRRDVHLVKATEEMPRRPSSKLKVANFAHSANAPLRMWVRVEGKDTPANRLCFAKARSSMLTTPLGTS